MVTFQKAPFVLSSAMVLFLEAMSAALAKYGEGGSVELSALPSPEGLEDDWPSRPIVFANPLELPYWTMSSSVEGSVALCPIPGVFGMIVLEDETFLVYTTGGWTIACLGPRIEDVGTVFCPIDGGGENPRMKLHLAKVQIGTRPHECYYHVL